MKSMIKVVPFHHSITCWGSVCSVVFIYGVLKTCNCMGKEIIRNSFSLIFLFFVFIERFSHVKSVTYTDLFMEKLDVFNCFEEN